MDKAQENHLEVKRTARFYSYGKVSAKTKDIIIAFHGYGQLGSYFASKFSNLANEETVIIIPEALSKFYLNDKYERVGASWITKENRENEVKDMISYLNLLWKSLAPPKGVKVHLFGFSQGCSTALRWANQLKTPITTMVLWAGYFANGVEDMIAKDKLNGIEKYYIYGDQDQFLLTVPELAETMKKHLLTLDFELIEFKGTHKTPIEELNKVYQRIFS